MMEPRRSSVLPRFASRRRGRNRRDPLPPSLRPHQPIRAEPVATGRWPWPRREAELPWAELASLLAHVGLMALLLLHLNGRGASDQPQSSPAVDIVFEDSQPESQASGSRSGEMPDAVEPPSPAEAPPPDAPPPPALVPQPPRVAAPPPPPAPPLAALPHPPAAPTPPPEPTLAELPPRPTEPVPRLSAEIPPTEIPPDLLAPPVPLQLNAPRVQPNPRPTPRPTPRPQQAQRPPGLYLPEGLSFSQPRPAPGRPTGQRQGLDLSVSSRLIEGRVSSNPSVQVRGAQVGQDWYGAFHRWLDQHLRYPVQAAQEGDSGQVRVRITASPDGTVRVVRLTGASTSPWLNTGTTQPFAGARLPAFPTGANPDGVEVDLTVNYVLIRR